MNRKISLMIIMMFLLMLVTACSGDTVATIEVTTDSTSIVEDLEITPTVDICNPMEFPNIAFPRQEPVEGPRETMAAELVGDLVLNDGCLRIESLYGDESYLPIWPPEFTVGLEGEVPVVLDGQGDIAGRVGDEIYMGGGEASENALPACVREQMPEDCGGKVWVVGDGVRLNLKFDSDLFKMDLVPALDRTAIFLKKEPVLDDWAGEPDSVTGILRFYYPDRCPRIKSESGTRDFLPIWPTGYSLQISQDLVEILDDHGKVVARQDEAVTLNGALVPPKWENPNYRQLHYETPGDCIGPYWIVEE